MIKKGKGEEWRWERQTALSCCIVLLYSPISIFPSLNRCINYCQDFCSLTFVGMYVVRDDGIIINAVSFFEQIGGFAIADFHNTFHNHNKLFTFV